MLLKNIFFTTQKGTSKMKVRIKETGEIKDLTYYDPNITSVDPTPDIIGVGTDDAFEYDRDAGIWVINSVEAYEWWADKLEKAAAYKKLVNEFTGWEFPDWASYHDAYKIVSSLAPSNWDGYPSALSKLQAEYVLQAMWLTVDSFYMYDKITPRWRFEIESNGRTYFAGDFDRTSLPMIDEERIDFLSLFKSKEVREIAKNIAVIIYSGKTFDENVKEVDCNIF
jgi:hypothetical protein